MMADPVRFDKMLGAWLAVYREINAAYPQTGDVPWFWLKDHAPGLANRIEDAEKRAEEKSVVWVNGGPGGVQAQIDEWRDLWLEALKMVNDARN